MMIEYYEYTMKAELLCISERMKKGNYRPCVSTIPFSTITGALKEAYFEREDDVFAAGYITAIDGQPNNDNVTPQLLTVAPQNLVTGVAREGIAPVMVEYLHDIEAKVFVVKNEAAEKTIGQNNNLRINIGGFRSKGMGCATLTRASSTIMRKQKGILLTRIPEKYINNFGIDKVIRPRFCYLHEPDPARPYSPNVYNLSYMEGSEVEGTSPLIREVTK